ncbi:MAG: TIGR00300 family protein [Actinomycetota bacterium]|nr:TIGR00300 family protein [Actinomycetota bacterium]
MPAELVEVEGHIIDSLVLAKVLDLVVAAGADYQMVDVRIGRTNADPSKVRLEVRADDEGDLVALLEELQVHGANLVGELDAVLETCTDDGVLPAGFYATTNLPTWVRLGGRWHPVENPEMDCALVVTTEPAPVVRTVPMHRVIAGERVVTGREGVRVDAPERPHGATPFEFMASEVSSEKPKSVLVAEVAERLRANRRRGGRLLVVCGPAVIHTGAGPDLARLVRAGWVDVVFAGNGFAVHDLEADVLGTSLGVSVHAGTTTEGGHSNHLRVINEIRRWGSIEAAVRGGYVTGGVMYECVEHGVPFVLGGSVRDDGPLPDVRTDVVAALDEMRQHLAGVGVALMLASTLHAVATGNILPANVETYCVDINQAVVTKLADRGSRQALGIVTDVGLFVRDLAARLDRP